MVQPIVRRSTLLLLSLAAAGLLTVASHAREPVPAGRERQFHGDEAERATKIQKEFQDAGTELAETHAEAVRREELQKPLQELSDAMKAQMIRLAPEQKGEIERQYVVHREIVRLGKIEHPTEADKEQFSATVLEYNNLTEALGDLPKRAAAAPEMRPAREKFQKQLLAVMVRINPKVPVLMKQQRKSITDYNELTTELIRQHGGAPIQLVPTPELPR